MSHWQEVAANTIRAVWKYLLPYCANNFFGFRNRLDTVIEKISVIGKDLGFEDVDSPHVKECLDLHSQPLTDMDIIELEQHHTHDRKKKLCLEEKAILIKELYQMFQNLETQIMDLDPNVERSILVCCTLENGLSCCHKL